MSEATSVAPNVQATITKQLVRDDRSAEARTVCGVIEDALSMNVDQIQDFLQDMLPLNVLFIQECFVDYRIFAPVRSLLEAIGVRMPPNRKLIPAKVAMALYKDREDAEESLRRFEDYNRSKSQPRHASGQPSTASSPVVVTQTGGDSLGRNKASVVSSFKDEDKFTGSVSGKVSLHRVRNKFIDAIRDQGIPKPEEVNLLHCCLSGMALDFYYKSIRGIATTIEQAFKILEEQFNTLQHQAQARTYLSNLTFDGIKREKSCTALEALEISHSRIMDTVPNCGREYQHDTHYCDFLQKVVCTEPWTQQVIQNRLTPAPNEKMDYNTFYSKLGAALTAFESNQASAISDSHTGAAIYFGERYASPAKPSRSSGHRFGGTSRSAKTVLDVMSSLRPPNRVKGNMAASRLAQLKARTKCLHCKQVGHWRHEYPNRAHESTKNVMMSLVQDIGNDDSAVAAVLWALSEDDDEYYAYLSLSRCDVSEDTNTAQLESGLSPFAAFVSDVDALPAYDKTEACEDLRNCFEVIIDELPGSNVEEQEAFATPARK